MAVLATLAKLFPPPRFMTLPSAGVDISDSSVKYIRFSEGGERLRLEKWDDIPIKDGVLKKGFISNQDELASILEKVRDEAGVDFVRISLPEERAYLFETVLKGDLSPEEIRNAIEFGLEENVPLSPRDALFDYDRIGVTDAGDICLSVTVYGKDAIASYYDVCRRARVTPLSFEVEAQAIARAVVREGDTGTHLIVDFGKSRTGIGIVEKDTLRFTTTIDIGGETLDIALKSVHPDASPEELIRLKNEYGILDVPEEAALKNALSVPIGDLKTELSSRISYWKTHPSHQDGHEIDSVILCGGIANVAGLPEYLSEELSVPVALADVWQNAFLIDSYVPPITRRYSYGYATAIGLALGAHARRAD